MMAENDDVFAQAGFGCCDAVVQGVVRNKQVGVKIAPYARLNLRSADSGRLAAADEGAAFRDGNEMAHCSVVSTWEVVILRSLNRCQTLFSHIQGHCPQCPLSPNEDHGPRRRNEAGLIDAMAFFLFVD